MAYRNYATANGFIVAKDGTGDFLTVTTAMAAAVSGNLILIRNGTYTENFTWTAGVDIVAYETEAFTPNVTIIGTVTATDAGSRTMSGIRLQTNSAFLLAVTGTAATVVNLKNCYLNATNNTAISHTSNQSTSQITLDYCKGNLGTTAITYFISTSAGGITFNYCNMANSGASTLTSSTSTQNIGFAYSEIDCPITTSSTGSISGRYSYFNTTGINTTSITLAGSGSSSFDRCILGGGSASALSAGAGTIAVLNDCTLNSANTNNFTGAGSVQYGMIMYSGTSFGHNATTETIKLGSAFQEIVVQTFTTGTSTYTPTAGMKYCIVELQAPGGGGGATTAAGATGGSSGAGGGGGGYSRKTFTAATIGASQTVTMGAVGTAGATSGGSGGNGTTSTFGALLSCTGGIGGQGLGASTTPQSFNGSLGGIGSGGDVNAAGGMGGQCFNTSAATGISCGGNGGSSVLGGGGQGAANGTNPGAAGRAYGGGGGGGATIASGAAQAGGAGGAGICIVTEYL